MPELPEVEFAARRLRRVLRGRTIVRLRAHHPAQARTLTAAVVRRVEGARVMAVARRGKHQLLHLADGALLLVHFRLNGDWEFSRVTRPLPRHARVTLELDDGRRVALTDSRALCTVSWHAPGHPPRLDLGPEAEDPAVTPAVLRDALARKRGPIKPALLDQRLLAGIGNIYASEACWHARIDPRARASSLSLVRVARLLAGIRTALVDGHVNADRYRDGERSIPFKVYEREGLPCVRCRRAVRRTVQCGRSTYWCSGCQA